MHLVARTPDDFRRLWNGVVNFLLDPELFAFEMNFPPVEEIVDILRRDADARIQFLADDLSDEEQKALAETFKKAPLESAVEMPFSLAHFHLQHFYGAGKFLARFQECVMIPWRTFLSRLGFTWLRCYPIIFISGKGCSSTFHADNSHVLAWQISGVKYFNGFKNPEKYAPVEKCVHERHSIRRLTPPEYDPDDVLSYKMVPGDVLWNQLLTPHWVPAGEDAVAASVNISHGGVAYAGAFCPNEQVLRKRWEAHPEEAWQVDLRY